MLTEDTVFARVRLEGFAAEQCDDSVARGLAHLLG